MREIEREVGEEQKGSIDIEGSIWKKSRKIKTSFIHKIIHTYTRVKSELSLKK